MRETISIAVFDPNDPGTVENIVAAIRQYHSLVVPCSTPENLLSAISKQKLDVVIISLEQPFEKMFSLLSEIKARSDRSEVVFLSQFDDQTLWVWMEAIQRGAYEFLPKPADPVELKRVIVRATEKHHPVRPVKRPPAESIRTVSLAKCREKAMAAGTKYSGS